MPVCPDLQRSQVLSSRTVLIRSRAVTTMLTDRWGSNGIAHAAFEVQKHCRPAPRMSRAASRCPRNTKDNPARSVSGSNLAGDTGWGRLLAAPSVESRRSSRPMITRPPEFRGLRAGSSSVSRSS